MAQKVMFPTTIYSNNFGLLLFFALQCLMSMVFLYEAVRGGVPMRPEVYGLAVYTVPAELWAILVFLAGAPYIAGAFIGGNFGATLGVISGLIGVGTQTALSIFTFSAAHGDALMLMCGLIGAPMSATVLVLSFLSYSRG
ncbi:hypothetical protein OU789_10780 [Halocynthiibacter sp. C4]|uniref:hypothetical protein n=1 Tax=Halocynthiibacter sp. C4 TaxID=2992758 RepID=UPI00237A7694|nr:hypothetical protein [Halocynthiibacter sp. C4]MDE0590411.1 hypothetical protein [Halocynthiibacter sp. C4]